MGTFHSWHCETCKLSGLTEITNLPRYDLLWFLSRRHDLLRPECAKQRMQDTVDAILASQSTPAPHAPIRITNATI